MNIACVSECKRRPTRAGEHSGPNTRFIAGVKVWLSPLYP